jgi:hypothetical protein
VSGVHLKPTPKSNGSSDFGTTTADFVASAFSLNNASSTLSDPTARPDAQKKEGTSNAHRAS